MISVHFQGKSFNITVFQVCAPTTNAKKTEVEWFYEEVQDLLELTPKKDVLFIIEVAISFSRGSSQPRNQTQMSYIEGRFSTD